MGTRGTVQADVRRDAREDVVPRDEEAVRAQEAEVVIRVAGRPERLEVLAAEREGLAVPYEAHRLCRRQPHELARLLLERTPGGDVSGWQPVCRIVGAGGVERSGAMRAPDLVQPLVFACEHVDRRARGQLNQA